MQEQAEQKHVVREKNYLRRSMVSLFSDRKLSVGLVFSISAHSHSLVSYVEFSQDGIIFQNISFKEPSSLYDPKIKLALHNNYISIFI